MGCNLTDNNPVPLNVISRTLISLSFVVTLLGVLPAYAQNTNDPNRDNENTLNPHFASMTKEVGVVCGEFLPNQINGMYEMMALCGGRFGLRIGENTILEPMLVAGAAKGQQYLLGSLSFRGDFELYDLVASIYAGADIHYATTPVYTGALATNSQTDIYFGGHLGGAIWWDLTQDLFLRLDMQFNLNPGTSLFAALSLAIRFDPASNQPESQGQR